MVPVSTILSVIVTTFIALILPGIVGIVYAVKNKGKRIWSAWFLGAAGFFIPQIIIRVPILQLISQQPWFLSFSENHTVLYFFILAFTAGLFELAGRLAAAYLLNRKGLTFPRAMAAGLGHGGIESIFLIGLTYLGNLAFIALINTGGFDAMVSQAAATGADSSVLLVLRDSLVNDSGWLFLAAGLERILTMISHLGMSVIVCYSLHTGKVWKGCLICLALHTLIDFSTILSTVLPQHLALISIYSIILVVAVLSVRMVQYACKHWEVVCHAVQE